VILFVGCLFYFSQCIWRQIQSKGLLTKYRDDEHFHLNVKKLIALAFVPLVDVVKGFDLIAENFDDDAEHFIDYFEKVWIGKPKRRRKVRLKKVSVTVFSIKEPVEKNRNLNMRYGTYVIVLSVIYHDQITRWKDGIMLLPIVFPLFIQQFQN
jgi:hypothetical protein